MIRAFLHCNATLQDIANWWYGLDDPVITHLIAQFYVADSLYNIHKNDMLALVEKSKVEAAKAKAQK